MMRRLFYAGTAIFWMAVGAFWLSSRLTPSSQPPGPQMARRISLDDVARHNTPDNCWMAINGQVYDVTGYLPEHPSRPSIILQWCGREASEAYRTKTKERPHSPNADRLLSDYWIGEAIQ